MRLASAVAVSLASATIFLPSSRAASRISPASVRASASWRVYSSSAASACFCASSALAMLPSMAAARSSSMAVSLGIATFHSTTRMMTKQIADQKISYGCGISGLGACSSAAVTRAFSILSPYVSEDGSVVAEDEAGGDADEGERLGEGDTDPHQHLQATGQLGLTGDALDRLSDDDADADGRADGCEAVADGCDGAVDLSENRSCVHGIFPFDWWAGGDLSP